MYKYLFGPVPSRRLGISLGVDLVTHKICSLNCIYCECGETTDLTLKRKEYVPYDKVTGELEHYFKNSPDPDYITFSGSGEPCLNSRIGEVIDFIKKKKKEISIAVLTNGTLLSQKDVRKALLRADLVIPSLDAASDSVFQKINRPEQKIDIEEYIRGLSDFRDEYKGKIALELLILPGINDSREEILLLKDAFEKIRPDVIQLNTLDRPGVVSGIRPATQEELNAAVNLFKPLNVEIIASAPQRKNVQSYRDDMESAILETIQRRPCTLEDLAGILGTHINEINKYLAYLEQNKKIESVRQQRGLFYQTRK
ncbi:MAG: radical SAM protein [Thermodesulfobacteriota bacterium]|nr:radical SAM protein [Thermodesulfobacteriota bacterium]